jgi:Asp-tRNA(Asn)/Glu-tRNA(Gln) amidotransferase B subunit
MSIDFEAEVEQETSSGPTDSELRAVATLAQRQVELEASVKHLEDELKKEKERLRKVAEVELPELLLNELNLSMFALADGTKVEVKDSLKCSVPKKNLREVAEWLTDRGHGALVKRDVTLPFDKGQEEQVKALAELLEANGFSQYAVSEAVHTGQLKKLIQELEEEGEDVPLSLFGAYHHKASKVTKA